jgi:hypothetical protein
VNLSLAAAFSRHCHSAQAHTTSPSPCIRLVTHDFSIPKVGLPFCRWPSSRLLLVGLWMRDICVLALVTCTFMPSIADYNFCQHLSYHPCMLQQQKQQFSKQRERSSDASSNYSHVSLCPLILQQRDDDKKRSKTSHIFASTI